MTKQRDLLPWILGGLSAATIAVAFSAVSGHRAAPTAPPTAVVAAQPPALPEATPAPPAAQATTPVAQPNSEPLSAASPVQAAVAPPASAGQIWTCTTKGVKTFSNNPCGEKSTLLDIGPINSMSVTPAMHYVRAPAYASQYHDSSDQEEYAEQYPAEEGGNSYTVIEGGRFVPRKRPDHFHRPTHHHNPSHDPGHNTAPMRR